MNGPMLVRHFQAVKEQVAIQRSDNRYFSVSSLLDMADVNQEDLESEMCDGTSCRIF